MNVILFLMYKKVLRLNMIRLCYKVSPIQFVLISTPSRNFEKKQKSLGLKGFQLKKNEKLFLNLKD